MIKNSDIRRTNTTYIPMINLPVMAHQRLKPGSSKVIPFEMLNRVISEACVSREQSFAKLVTGIAAAEEPQRGSVKTNLILIAPASMSEYARSPVIRRLRIVSALQFRRIAGRAVYFVR